MTAEELKKDILEKTAEDYRLVHRAKQAEPFEPGKSRVNYAGRVFDEREMTNLVFAGNITKHPCCEALKEGVDYRVVGDLENTDTIMNSSLWIGLYPGMGDEKLDYMVATIGDFCRK